MKMRLTLGILMLWILSVIKVLNLAADGAWEQKADMPAAKSGHKAEVINGNIYIIDGPAHNDTPFATVEVYDTGEFHQSVDPIGKRLERWGMIKKVDILPR